jgi:S-adenosyl-L-methionine hydrolase (adenosine-forming)
MSMRPECILLFTDFGWHGPYVGQLHRVLVGAGCPVIDLMHDAPCFNPRAASYLLAALAETLPRGGLFLGVVDPGVGGGRRGIVLRTAAGWLVGPDNGLLVPAARRLGEVAAWCIDWCPPGLSASFHGRDLFAPICVRLARGEAPPGTPIDPVSLVGWGWPAEVPEIVYFDSFGNAYTGLWADAVPEGCSLRLGDSRLPYARTFGAVAPGEGFWYRNSCGLVEIAVNQGSARERLRLAVGDRVGVEASPP